MLLIEVELICLFKQVVFGETFKIMSSKKAFVSLSFLPGIVFLCVFVYLGQRGSNKPSGNSKVSSVVGVWGLFSIQGRRENQAV